MVQTVVLRTGPKPIPTPQTVHDRHDNGLRTQRVHEQCRANLNFYCRRRHAQFSAVSNIY